MTIMETSNSSVAILPGGTVLYEYENERVSSVEVHQPYGLSPERVRAIHEAIDAHIALDYKLIQESYAFNGRVHIKKWKVVYE